MNVNAANASLATTLASSRANATFTGLCIRLNGGMKGRGAAKKLYGDHLVHDTFVTGFSYLNLVAKDLALLKAMTADELKALAAKGYTAWDNPRLKNPLAVPVTLADFKEAIAAAIASCERTVAGTNTSTSGHVYEPLVVDGKAVRGCRVYVGSSDPTAKLAAKPGTIYLTGLRVNRKVLEAAKNGDISAGRTGAVPLAKRVISKYLNLPSRRFVQYKLDPEASWVLNVGGAAATAADDAGVTVDAAAVQAIKAALV